MQKHNTDSTKLTQAASLKFKLSASLHTEKYDQNNLLHQHDTEQNMCNETAT